MHFLVEKFWRHHLVGASFLSHLSSPFHIRNEERRNLILISDSLFLIDISYFYQRPW